MRPARRLSRFQFFARLLPLALAASFAPGHANDRCAVLRRLVPSIDAGLISHLVDDDASQFRHYADGLPIAVVGAAEISLSEKIWAAPPDRYVRVLEFVGPYGLRIAEIQTRRTGLTESEHDIRYRMALGARGIELSRSVDAFHRLPPDPTIRPGDRLRRERALVAVFERLGYERGVIQIQGNIAHDLGQLGGGPGDSGQILSPLARARPAP